MVFNSGATASTTSRSAIGAKPTSAAASAAPASKPKFSFDKLFFGARRGKQKKLDPQSTASSASSSFFSRKAPHDAAAAGSGAGTAMCPSPPRGNSWASYRPPPITTPSDAARKQQQHHHHQPSAASKPNASAAAGVRLCQSPGGRSNMQLAVPVTPPPSSAVSKARAAVARLTQKPKPSDAGDGLRASAIYGRFSGAGKHALASRFSLGPWRERATAAPTLRASDAAAFPATHGDTAVQRFLASFPRDVCADVRAVCTPQSLSLARRRVARMLQFHVFEIRSTKWAAYFLQLVKRARALRQLSAAHAVSLRWAICAYVQREVHARRRKKEVLDQELHKKMTDYRVALQCIGGARVLKFGRKGKPHQTQLLIENGEAFRWTSKLRAGSKKKKAIALAAVLDVRAGPTTEVLARALQKGTLALQDAKCTMSLVTATRTFDIKARSAAEREWLHRSFAFLVALAREHEQRVAQQVELSIMKRMELLSVWKHGRKGRPHRTRIFVNRFGEISWQGRSNDSIQLDEVVAIDEGHRTPVFARSLGAGFTAARSASRCFSLVSRTRTLDIETESETTRDWFVVAFRYLMDKVLEKTAAMKREKAEKQLRLLQELCGGMGIPNVSAPAPAASLSTASASAHT
ncbi:hypothetical protein PybrP1_000253 [[Pythium] brassicae (nom. inval.)]|nr:hypothetical protein PybrP1_000253 [[Pythium] brassicae (nom. inval.)]